MTTAPEAAPDRAKLYRKIGLRILPILFVAYVVANLDRNNVGFAKLGFLPDLGFDDSVYGLGAGLFYLGYIVFEIPSNLWLTKIGVRLTFLRIMLLWFVFCFGFAFMTQPWHYHILRVLLGAAEAGFFPGVLLYLTFWIPRARRTRFIALFMAAMPVSGMVGAPLAGVIMHSLDGFQGLAGWQWLFVAEAIPAALMGLVVYFALSNTPKEAKWLTPAEREAVAADLAAEAPPQQKHGSALSALKDPRFYMIGAMAFALMSGLNGLNLWGPSILRNSGIESVLLVGLMASMPQLVGLVSQLTNAWHSDHTQERRFHCVIPALIAAAAWFALPQVMSHPTASMVLLAIIAAGSYAATAPFWTLPSLYLSGTSAAAGIALVTTVGGLGSMLNPMIIGWLSTTTGSLAAGQYFTGAVLIAGAASLLIGTQLLAKQKGSLG